MAILVSKHPEKRYQTVGSIGISDSDREQADRLDTKLERPFGVVEHEILGKRVEDIDFFDRFIAEPVEFVQPG